jgi:glycosyltransferase involved in cell wall biosynthesis
MRPADLSIIVPAHNAGATLEATLASARQADGLLEILVVDDGSSDDTLVRANRLARAWEQAGPPALRVLTQGQAGPSAARNLGAANAEGRLLAFLDADDTWLAGVPDARRDSLGTGPTVVLGLIQCYAGEPGRPEGDPFEGFQVGAALIPREVFEAVGPFEPGMDLGEDVDWFLRAREAGVALVFGSDVTLAYRSAPGSLSARRADRGHGLLDALHRSVDRRRSGGGSAR